VVDGPAEGRAVALSCPGLVPFVVEALRKMGDVCARLPAARVGGVTC